MTHCDFLVSAARCNAPVLLSFKMDFSGRHQGNRGLKCAVLGAVSSGFAKLHKAQMAEI